MSVEHPEACHGVGRKTRAFRSRLQRLLKEVGIEEQNGFMGGHGGSDGIFCIRQALKKRREHGKESWILFVDLVKASTRCRGTCFSSCLPSSACRPT